jgi:hypothetical protein
MLTLLLFNLKMCNVQQIVSLSRKITENYIEASTLCLFSIIKQYQAAWEIFRMLGFLTDVYLLGYLRPNLLPSKSLNHTYYEHCNSVF